MLNSVYRLVTPGRFEVCFSDIDIFSSDVIVRPTYLSICHADQRYYQGLRPPEILSEKLPMALIHEAIGEVVFSNNDYIKSGNRVVMIPNTPVEKDDVIAENYLRTSKFRASGFDGFMQDLVALSSDRVVPLPKNIDNQVGAFIELMSVSVHAISRFLSFSHKKRENVAIFGDGNLGFLTAVFLKAMAPDIKIMIFGVHEEKLSGFTFANDIYNVADRPGNISFDHAFECVGGANSGYAVNQIIDFIKPEGTISLLGVSEYPVPINTRMLLEKGLRLFGSSRSGYSDFEKTVELLAENTWISSYLSNLISDVVCVRDINDIRRAFDSDIIKLGGKTVMEWKK